MENIDHKKFCWKRKKITKIPIIQNRTRAVSPRFYDFNSKFELGIKKKNERELHIIIGKKSKFRLLFMPCARPATITAHSNEKYEKKNERKGEKKNRTEPE